MAEEVRGIKEVMEVLDLVEHLAVKGLDAAKDGIGIEDIAILLDPTLFAKANAAIGGLGDADDELKDLSIAEIKLVLDRLVDITAKVLTALKPAPVPAPAQ